MVVLSPADMVCLLVLRANLEVSPLQMQRLAKLAFLGLTLSFLECPYVPSVTLGSIKQNLIQLDAQNVLLGKVHWGQAISLTHAVP